jgi:hypothetical protein
LQTEISGRPWFTLICQSEGTFPAARFTVFKTTTADPAVRA